MVEKKVTDIYLHIKKSKQDYYVPAAVACIGTTTMLGYITPLGLVISVWTVVIKLLNVRFLLVFASIPTTLWKVLFIAFMYCCGFQIISCIMCILGCMHCFREPCLRYQAAGSWYDGFHALVYESKCEFDPKVRDFLTKIFKK